MLKRLLCFGFLSMLVAAMPAQAVNLVTNGNFNTGDTSGWWTYIGDPANEAISIVNPGGYDSTPALEMYNATGSFSATVGQTLAITAGMSFTESLVYADSQWGGSGITLWFYDVATPSGTWDEHVIGWNWNTIADNWASAGDGTWKSFTSPVITAPTGTQSVLFKLEQWGNSTIDYDNIVVTPEPATMLLLGLGGLALARRRKSA